MSIRQLVVDDIGGAVPNEGGTPVLIGVKKYRLSFAHTEVLPLSLLKGFRIAVFTGSDPNDTSKYVLPPIELGPSETGVDISLKLQSQITWNAAVQALYNNGNESSWRLLGGSVVSDPHTRYLADKTSVDNAQATADAAITQLSKIASDGWLTADEKPGVLGSWNDINGSKPDLVTKAGAAGVSSTAFVNAWQTLGTYLNNGVAITDATDPLYSFNRPFTDQAIASPATWDANWKAAYTERTKLLNAITAKAQATADSAVAAIGSIASDNILSKGEKSTIILYGNAIDAEVTDILTRASQAAVSSTAYNAAYTELGRYLAAAYNAGTLDGVGTGGTDWKNVATDSVIDGNTFRTKWQNYYTERTKLLNAITAKAQAGVDQINSVDYLANADKVNFMLLWAQEAQTQTRLDAQAAAVGVSTSAYDNAISYMFTVMTAAGAPPNWNTTWPDGTTFGPSTGVVNSIRNQWQNIATARTNLQNAISGAQASAAQSAAISTAATDALNKANAAQLASQPHQVAWAYSAKPALPNASYPAGYFAITTDSRFVQVNVAGTAWTDVSVATLALIGQIFTKNLVVLNFDNMLPNPNGVPPTAGYSSSLHFDHYRWAQVDGGSPTGYSHNLNSAPGYEKGIGFHETDGTALQVKGGEQYYMEAKIYVSSAANGSPGLYWYARDAAGAVTNWGQVLASGAAFNSYSMNIAVPANSATLNVYAFCPNGSQASVTGLYLRRRNDGSLLVDGAVTAIKLAATAIQTVNYSEDGSGNPTSGAALKTAGVALKVEPAGLQIGATLFSNYMLTRIAQAIDGNSANGRVIYRGNIDTTVRGGAPNIASLTVIRRRWDTTVKVGRLELSLMPSAVNDNLDAMRWAKVELYRQSAAGTSGTLTPIDTYWPTIADRRYGNFATDYDSNNSGGVTFETVDSLISSGYPAAIVTLYNTYGFSPGNCFYSAAGNADGSTLTNNGTSFPAGLTGGSSGGGGYGGGGGGGACPAPWVKVDLASGIKVDAGDLHDGAKVVGIDEITGEPAVGTIRAPRLVFQMRQAVILEDGRAPEFSELHRVLVGDKGWTEVRNLVPGDVILGRNPGTVKSLGLPHRALVVQFQVDGCATYLSDGLLSHNQKMIVY